jgi:uncharacterized protein (TIGR02145 family)
MSRNFGCSDNENEVTILNPSKTHSHFRNLVLLSISFLIVLSLGCNKDDEDNPQIIIETGKVTDIDGNVYKTKKIGNQWWMAKNLKVTHFSDGTEIELVESTLQWINLDLTQSAYCYFANSSSNGDEYGALYNWSAAMNGAINTNDNSSNIQGVCPVGWHIPRASEWEELFNYLGGKDNAGLKLKEVGTEHWSEPNLLATNESGFTALPGGARSATGNFSSSLSALAYYWSATLGPDSTYVKRYELFYNYTGVKTTIVDKNSAISVRCVK